MIIIVFISQYLLCIETSENMFQSLKVDLPNYKTQINFHNHMNQSNDSQLNSKRIHIISSNTTNQYHPREEHKLHNNKSVESHGDYYHSSLSSTSITTPVNEVKTTINFITFKISDCYLHNPSMHLYEKFRLQFTFRTSQEHGLILFNSDKYGVDFLAFELIKGYLHFVFDMGSGSQRFALTAHSVTDSKWHNVELFRKDLENNILQLYIDRNQSIEQYLKIPVFNGDIARNFNLNDPLYIGGISQLVFLKWREKLSSYHGFQGCLGNFSINGLPPFDLLNMAKLKYAKNWTLPVCRDQIVDNCHYRPKGVLNCNQIQRIQNHSTMKRANKNGVGDNDNNKLFQPYCLNDGICLHTWLGVKCACELTTFDGHRCIKAGTTFAYGVHDDTTISYNLSNNINQTINDDDDNNDHIGYLRLIYTDRVRNTRQDEFVLGIQTILTNLTYKQKQYKNNEQISHNYITTLLFVTSLTQIGDFIHLFLESGVVRLNYNMGGGVVHISGPNFPINDGFYHRIRGYRVDRQIILEVDDSRHTYELNSIYGKQFNNQKVIWLGHAPQLNKTDFFHGYMTGVYYNGLLLNDIAAGLSYLMYIHVTRFGNVKHTPKFQPKLLKSDYYKDGVNYVNRDEPVNEETTKQILTDSLPLLFYSNSSSSSSLLSSNYKYFNNNISNESIQSDIIHSQTNDLQYNKLKVFKTMSRLHEQVNIWLLISLAGAGLIMIISLTFLAYRCHRNKHVNSHCSKLTETKQMSHLHQFSPTSVTYRTASVGSLLSMDDIRYTMISKRLKQNQEQLSSVSDDQSHSLCDRTSISGYKINYSNTTVTPFILVTDSINLPRKSSTGIDQYNLVKTSLPKIGSMHFNVNELPMKTFEQYIPDKYLKDNEYKVVLNVSDNDYLKTQYIHGFIDTLNSGQFNTDSSIETSQMM
ncbi:unnamed protein product [Schistosoma margrebowiei]|uniref:Laminin G domain-containing protein n=1 Tax=Schistosoma margrebowiei TaxID=48269 RepID=A0AA84ZCS8_9TREM|nr:unnamed protein product [Schistosoma margrebowiei]